LDVSEGLRYGSFISNFSSEMIRKTVTFYDDQYKFFKSFKSEKLLVAFVEFMFEDIEPE
jgi:hypothetical protein